MDVITLAMIEKAMPKIIDLTKYGEGTTIADAIAALVASGGGFETVSGSSAFWEAAATDSPVKVTYPFGNYIVETSSVTVLKTGASIAEVCFASPVYMPGTGAVVVNVMLYTGGGNVTVNVKVTPLS